MNRAGTLICASIILGGCGGAQASGTGSATGEVAPTTTTAPTAQPPAPTPPAVEPPMRSQGGSPNQQALELPCRKKARDVEGDQGASQFVRCPADCVAEAGTVWGTDFYTDDSAVCPALIHAGALSASGGVAKPAVSSCAVGRPSGSPRPARRRG